MNHNSHRTTTARASRRVAKPETFTVEFPDTSRDGLTLQDAFTKFLSTKKKTKKFKRRKKRSVKKMEGLRRKFLERALSYTGVPYARRYYTEDEPEYQLPLFLDCCGLVRRVMYDLQDEFGFRIGPWNQAYMYDTLWKNCSGPEEMKPGDLIFIRGVYYNTNKRQQKHNITHVEIYMGEGDKSLGARWQRGRVQIFDTYYFESKSYKIEEYIFKSLDPWLMGHCKSHCSEHKWKQRRVRTKNKYSIFADKTLSQMGATPTNKSTTQLSNASQNETTRAKTDQGNEDDDDDDIQLKDVASDGGTESNNSEDEVDIDRSGPETHIDESDQINSESEESGTSLQEAASDCSDSKSDNEVICTEPVHGSSDVRNDNCSDVRRPCQVSGTDDKSDDFTCTPEYISCDTN